jgi:hypothetical protein
MTPKVSEMIKYLIFWNSLTPFWMLYTQYQPAATGMYSAVLVSSLPHTAHAKPANKHFHRLQHQPNVFLCVITNIVSY